MLSAGGGRVGIAASLDQSVDARRRVRGDLVARPGGDPETLAQATDYLERAVALRPQDPVINDHLGDAYWRVGRDGEARIQWQRVLGLDPDEDLVQQIQDKLRDGLPPYKKRGGDG